MAVLCVARALAVAVAVGVGDGVGVGVWLMTGPVPEDRGIGSRGIQGRRGGHLGECCHYYRLERSGNEGHCSPERNGSCGGN